MDETNDKPQAQALVPEVVIIRDDLGRFAPGGRSSPGRPKGGLDRITKLMKEQLSKHLEETGTKGNPLVILANIFQDTDEASLVRCRAIEILLRHISPMLLKVEAEAPDENTDTEIASLKQALRAVLLKGLPGAGPTSAR